MRRFLGSFTAIVLLASPVAHSDVIITEIMYNPSSKEAFNPDENLVEWVEIYNTGPVAVDISGWYLQDEDGKTEGLPRNTSIRPGQAIVLVPGGMTAETFRAAWGDGFDIYPLAGWGKSGLGALANSPSDKNEILTLRKPDEALADRVNYDDENGWPADSGASSIYLKAAALDADANDKGESWAASVDDEAGARTNKAVGPFNGKDIGSPGVVAK